jgi:hypothetical protein
MGECGLSISLNQLKLKVAKMTQIKVTPWWDGILEKISGDNSRIEIQMWL